MGGLALLLWCACACYAAEYGAQMPLYEEPAPLVRSGSDDQYNAHSLAAPDYEYEDLKDKDRQQENVDTPIKDVWGQKYRNRYNEGRRAHDVNNFSPEDDVQFNPSRQSYDIRSKRYRAGVGRGDRDYIDYRSRARYDEYSTMRRRRRPRDRQMEAPSDDETGRLEAGVDRDLDVISLQKEEEARAQRILGEERPPYRPTPPPPPKIRPVSEFEQYDHHYYDAHKAKSVKDEPPLPWRPTQARLVPLPPLLGVKSNRRVMDAEPAAVEPSVATSSATRTSSVNTTPTSSSNLPSNASKELSALSVAERSRLSILKKALRKEMLRGGGTSKPPVLLQVTRASPTLVVVEAQSPHFRAENLASDSPARLRKVKRLMRNKLLASARSVHDLTDNWDELICDYVDTSLLDDGANIPPCATPYLVIMFFLILRL